MRRTLSQLRGSATIGRWAVATAHAVAMPAARKPTLPAGMESCGEVGAQHVVYTQAVTISFAHLPQVLRTVNGSWAFQPMGGSGAGFVRDSMPRLSTGHVAITSDRSMAAAGR